MAIKLGDLQNQWRSGLQGGRVGEELRTKLTSEEGFTAMAPQDLSDQAMVENTVAKLGPSAMGPADPRRREVLLAHRNFAFGMHAFLEADMSKITPDNDPEYGRMLDGMREVLGGGDRQALHREFTARIEAVRQAPGMGREMCRLLSAQFLARAKTFDLARAREFGELPDRAYHKRHRGRVPTDRDALPSHGTVYTMLLGDDGRPLQTTRGELLVQATPTQEPGAIDFVTGMIENAVAQGKGKGSRTFGYLLGAVVSNVAGGLMGRDRGEAKTQDPAEIAPGDMAKFLTSSFLRMQTYAGRPTHVAPSGAPALAGRPALPGLPGGPAAPSRGRAPGQITSVLRTAAASRGSGPARGGGAARGTSRAARQGQPPRNLSVDPALSSEVIASMGLSDADLRFDDMGDPLDSQGEDTVMG